MSMTNENHTAVIVLLGRVGQGKTRLLNLLCSTSFPSGFSKKMSTMRLQEGISKQHGIKIIDTPGFGSSANTSATFVEYQKSAIESHPLSGMYVVVKFGRVDDMASSVSMILGFVREREIRIIISFVDSIPPNVLAETISMLSSFLGIQQEFILTSGLDTNAVELENNIRKTLHSPQIFRTDEDHEALVCTQHVGSRMLHGQVDAICQADKHTNEAVANIEQARSTILETAAKFSVEEKMLLIEKLEDSRRKFLLESSNNTLEREATLSALIETIPKLRKRPRSEAELEDLDVKFSELDLSNTRPLESESITKVSHRGEEESMVANDDGFVVVTSPDDASSCHSDELSKAEKGVSLRFKLSLLCCVLSPNRKTNASKKRRKKSQNNNSHWSLLCCGSSPDAVVL